MCARACPEEKEPDFLPSLNATIIDLQCLITLKMEGFLIVLSKKGPTYVRTHVVRYLDKRSG